MSRSYWILGHGNATLAMLIDMLLERHPEQSVDVHIISNIPVDDSAPFQFASVQRLQIHESELSEWDGVHDGAVLGVGTPRSMQIVLDDFRESHGIEKSDFLQLSHPSAIVAHAVQLDSGVTLGPRTVIAPYAHIGCLTFVNRGATVGHHTTIGEMCRINPGANIAGHCQIGNSVSIGIGATIIDHIEIGNNTVVGAGSVVTKPLPDNVVAYGVPARVVREVGPE